MPSTVPDIGVTAYSEVLTQSVEISTTLEELHIAQKDGTYGQGKGFDPTTEVSVSGRGDLPTLAIGGSATITGVSGGVSIITNISQSEKNEDYADWSFTMQNWPSASA
tara:strand:+ start:562 stop:885 length:324 start_codon:yes stop_codon:yes gene_type:complete